MNSHLFTRLTSLIALIAILFGLSFSSADTAKLVLPMPPLLTGASPEVACERNLGPEAAAAEGEHLCRLACVANAMARGDRSYEIPPRCETPRQMIERQARDGGIAKLAVGCVAGAWSALTENVMAILSPDEAVKFIAECEKNPECRRNLARTMDAYRAKKADGSYLMSDEEVDRAVATLNLQDLLRRSRHNEGVTYDSCRNHLAEITRELSTELAEAEGASQTAVLQKRYDRLASFDSECPSMLKLESPAKGLKAPDPGKAIKSLAQGAKHSAVDLAKRVDEWFTDLGIAFQCYDSATQGDLLCYGVGKVLLDPVLVGTGTIFAAKAMARAGLKTVAKTTGKASRTVESLKAVKTTEVADVVDPEKYVPIARATAIRSETIRAEEAEMLSRLTEQGAEFRPTLTQSFFTEYVDRGWADEVIPDKTDVPYRGRVVKITKLPPAQKTGTFTTRALEHPEMQEALERMKAEGFDLVVDTSLVSMQTGAYYSGHKRVIAITPDTTWATFRHEVQHMDFDRTVKPSFERLVFVHNKGRNIVEALPGWAVAEIGLEKVERMQKLFNKGITPEIAVDETLAVEAELKTMGWRQYLPGVGTEPRRYAIRHQITEIEKLGAEATAQQKSLARRLRVQHDRLEMLEKKSQKAADVARDGLEKLERTTERVGEVARDPRVQATAAAAGVATATAGVAARAAGGMSYEYIGENYRRVLYDDKGHVLGERKDGTGWELIDTRKTR